MSSANIHDASAAKTTTHEASHFQGLVQLLARQASGLTHRSREPVEQVVGWKATEIPSGQPSARRRREHQDTLARRATKVQCCDGSSLAVPLTTLTAGTGQGELPWQTTITRRRRTSAATT